MVKREPAGGERVRRELRSPPSTLRLLARAGVGLIPGASRLPVTGGGGGRIPAIELRLSHVAIDRDRLSAYDRLCAFGLSDTLPPTYPHLLAFPLALALITDGAFPLPAIGLVQIANRIVAHRPIAAHERLSLRVWATGVDPHPRGRQFTLHTEARAGDELIWEEESTNLQRRGGPPREPAHRRAEPRELPATATWRLKDDLGRRYGALSGDLNPIHMHPLAARLFGFPGAIAHGMWTTARCLAALGPRLPDACAIDVAFKRPIVLPATVTFAQATEGETIAFAVRDAVRGTPHLEGVVSGPTPD